MFRAVLVCNGCGFKTDEFIVKYYQPSERFDFVFQDTLNHRFRVVTFTVIESGKRLSDAELEILIKQLGSNAIESTEQEVELWIPPNEFGARYCPKCHEKAVGLDLLTII